MEFRSLVTLQNCLLCGESRPASVRYGSLADRRGTRYVRLVPEADFGVRRLPSANFSLMVEWTIRRLDRRGRVPEGDRFPQEYIFALNFRRYENVSSQSCRT
jgi:hypothetical protein